MTVAVLIMLIVYIFFYKKVFRKYKSKQLIVATALYFYVWLVLFLTIIPSDFSLNPNYRNVIPIKYPYDNLKPYHDFLLKRPGSLEDILLNILMMIPFGFLLSKLKNAGLFKVAFTTFVFSSFIETSQLILTIFIIEHRFFDITDIINNTIGGIIGYLIYRLYRRHKEVN